MQAILIIYLVIAGITGIYFNWIFAVNNGFLAWFFFGEIISTLQGLVWPIYLF